MKFQNIILNCKGIRSLLLIWVLVLGLHNVEAQITFPYNFTYAWNEHLLRNNTK